jgi:hypothetical protein
MRPHDTSQAAHEFQIRGYRRMDAGQKAELVAGLSSEGNRQRHPGYGDDDVTRALVVLLYAHSSMTNCADPIVKPCPRFARNRFFLRDGRLPDSPGATQIVL